MLLFLHLLILFVIWVPVFIIILLLDVVAPLLRVDEVPFLYALHTETVKWTKKLQYKFVKLCSSPHSIIFLQ